VLGFQHYILALGTAVMIPSFLVPLMGGTDVSHSQLRHPLLCFFIFFLIFLRMVKDVAKSLLRRIGGTFCFAFVLFYFFCFMHFVLAYRNHMLKWAEWVLQRRKLLILKVKFPRGLSFNLHCPVQRIDIDISNIDTMIQDDKVRVVQTLLFVEGVNTLLQTLFGTRLPTVIGGSYAFMVPIISIIHDSSLTTIEDPHLVCSFL